MCDVVGEGGRGWINEPESIIVTKADEAVCLTDMVGSHPWFRLELLKVHVGSWKGEGLQ